jgi:3-hydroxyacyl-CoA dehydrogenase/enoyl-CoA hydratase/3-hydroxybutyryl-CoA epimerase/3-hydroxyacyl-CoA dehydrogenase/enoyl-CoA hydratase/3-hydroxybutyryl-CoA epimerase/enoyl-CoA isomerase
MPASVRDPATLAVERHSDGLVVLTVVVPDRRHNVLTPRFLADLAAALDDLDRSRGRFTPRGIVLKSGREGSFFAGADVGRLDGLRELPAAEIMRLCDAGRGLFARLSTAPWPTVALIDGVCLGGGLELALACDLRVATTAAHTSLGFPEVKLGLLPGWGGTVRLPRLIGPGPAVELAASGESVDGQAAVRLGLVDACVPADEALETARRLIELETATAGIVARRRRMAEPVELDSREREFLEATTAAVILGRTGGHYPAPPAILKTILAGSGFDAPAAAALESQAFAKLAATPVSAQLVRVFRIGERNRHDPGVAGDVTAADVESAAVVGAGIMGAGIAASHLRAGVPVTLVDVNAETLAASVPGILDEAAWDRATKRTDPARALALSGSLRTAAQLAAIAGADLVIESVTERPDVKTAVLADIERLVGPETVIATNTSTNPITRLAEALADPARFCGLHFFNPVRRMTLVEVVRGPATGDATVATAVALAKRLGKCPIVVRDSPGFLVNRVLMPYLHEATELVREGIDPARIDRVARGFGMPMGPIELYDMIGLDTAFYAGLVLSAAYGDRIEASPLIPALVKSGRLGRKTGSGFYRYSGADQKARIVGVDPAGRKVLDRYAVTPRETNDRTLADRLLLPMLLEAVRALDEGIVRDPADIDLAVIHALGFPPFRGGLLAWADSLGAAEVLRRLEPLAGLGPRMIPIERVAALARSGGRFTG